MRELLIKLATTGTIMGVFDAFWLSVVAKKFYEKYIGSLLLEKFNMTAALLFYSIYVIGVVLFVINPALEKDSLSHAALYGALFGLVAYATYDLTNRATLKGFPWTVVVVDLLWGTLLTMAVSAISFTLIRRWIS